MNNYYLLLLFLCNAAILTAAIVAIIRFRYFDMALKMLAVLLIVTAVSELICCSAVLQKQLSMRYYIYHFFNVVQACLLSGYFLYAIRPARYRVIHLVCCILWIAFGIVNVCLWQPLRELNTNMLMLESLIFIAFPLYFIYRIVKDDAVPNIFASHHFWLSVIWLVVWGTSISFWTFVKILYRGGWSYMSGAITIQSAISIAAYLGMARVFHLYKRQPGSHG